MSLCDAERDRPNMEPVGLNLTTTWPDKEYAELGLGQQENEEGR